jgi:integral membrane protein
VIEATIYLVLVASVALHHLARLPDRAPVLGLVHGLWFLVYLALVVRAGARFDWPRHQIVTLLVVAAVPLGGYYVAGRLLDELPGEPSSPPTGPGRSRLPSP